MEWIIGGIIGYLLGASGRQTVYSTSYKVEDRYIGVVSYNPKTGRLIYFCSGCGGVGTVYSSRNSSYPYNQNCFTCNGKKVLSMILPADIRKEIVKRVKDEKKKHKRS